MIQPETTAGRFRFYERRRQERFASWWTDMGGAIHIPLKEGYEAIIDAQDIDSASRFVWNLVFNGEKTIAYAKANVPEGVIPGWKSSSVALHQIVFGANPKLQIDHKNRNGLDCRRKNLRQATRAQNCANRVWPKGTRCPYRGVAPSGSKWIGKIQRERKQIYLGIFETAEQAAVAYNKAAVEIHGEFAVLNEIPSCQ